MTFLLAIARQEGFNLSGSRSNRNNNPGDINDGAFSRAHGEDRIEVIPAGIHEEPRFAHFKTVAEGFAAMKALFQVPGVFKFEGKVRRLVSGYAGSTVREALYRYAPPDDGNDTSSYEANICEWVGCKPTDLIDPLIK